MAEYQCNATFSGDTDIGGIGVLTSYITFAVVTTIVAALNVYTPPTTFSHSFASCIAAEEKVKYNHKLIMVSMTDRSFWWHQFSCGLLSSLCDIQNLTSIGIVLAGLIQIHDLSMYHLNLIWDYWWLTFTAFWAESTEDRTVRPSRMSWLKRVFDREQIGTILMIVSVALAIGYQIFVYGYFQNAWDPDVSGRCYRFNGSFDLGDALLWIVVTCVFLLQLLVSLIPAVDEWIVGFDPWLGNLERRLISTHWTLRECHNGTQQLQPAHGTNRFLRLIGNPGGIIFLTIINLTALLILWSFRQFLGILGFTDGTRAIGFPVYIFYFILTVGDLLSVKVLNEPLITDECKWGFGQTLPMVLILSLGYQVREAVDLAEKKALERKALLKELCVEMGDGGDLDQARISVLETMLPPVKFARPVVGSLYAQAQAIEDRSGYQL